MRGIASIGWGVPDRIFLAGAFVYYSLLRAAGLNYAARPLRRVHVAIHGRRAALYIKGLLDLYVMDGVIAKEEYSFDMAPEPEVIFDLGANTGLTAVYFKTRYPDAKLFAFEPDPNSKEIVEHNAAAFGSGVVFLPVAVTGEPQESVEFYVSREHWSSSMQRKHDTDRLVRVPATTLDRAMAEHGVSHIDLLKFDVEGVEYDIFAHFRQLHRVRAVVGEVHMDLAHKTYEEFAALLPGFDLSVQPLHGGRVTVTGFNTRYEPR